MMHSDANDDRQVLRMRFNGLTDDNVDCEDDEEYGASTAV
jgi:hypothetical protein